MVYYVPMTWNYRVIGRKVEGFGEDDHEELGIHEVYYTRSGKPQMYSESPIPPVGGSIKELRSDLQRMLLALDKPVLTAEDFVGNDDEPHEGIDVGDLENEI